jgi:hypothetical protein
VSQKLEIKIRSEFFYEVDFGGENKTKINSM